MNNKIDFRHHYILCVDTETANSFRKADGSLDTSSVLVYDCGWCVMDTAGKVYEERSFVNRDIFVNEHELMQSAYYAKKIPQYEIDIANGSRVVATTYEIRKILIDKIKEYDCKFVCAHNARFDLTACNNIQRWTTKSKYRYFFPYGIEIWDTMKMARDVIAPMPTYQKFCADNGYLTKNGKVRLTAEILYRFISKDNSFIESHTGLEDVLIEKEIFAYCVKQHKAMRRNLFEK
jgi:hypothetical protein